MRAKSFAPSALRQNDSAFNGTVDANLKYTPREMHPAGSLEGHKTHDLGMALDLGISQYISKEYLNPLWNNAWTGVVHNHNGTVIKKMLRGNQYDTTALTAAETIAQLQANKGWSIARAVAWSNDPKLPWQDNDKDGNNQQAALKDFLSLYAVTRDDNGLSPGDFGPPNPNPTAGSRGSLPIENGGAQKEQIRDALFGDGTKSGALISQVLFGKRSGGNPYLNMRRVLENLDVSTGYDDVNHFHIYFKPPKLLTIDGSSRSLEADDVAILADTSAMPTGVAVDGLLNAAQAMLDNVSSASTNEVEMMITVDIPYAPIQDSPVVQMAQATSVNNTLTASDGKKLPRREVQMEYCQDVDNTFENSAFNSLPVLQGVLSHLGYHMSNDRPGFNAPPDVIAHVRNSKVTITEAPRHGTVARISPESYFWRYTPENGYQGKDKVTFLVEVLGRRYRIVVNILVHEVVDEGADPRVCETVFFRKGSSLDEVDSKQGADMSVLPATLGFSSGGSTSRNSQVFSIDFGNLVGTAVGQTTAPTITLDTDAAGHGWYVDPTPDANEEYLPTSNPNEWLAKPGSEAAGKMDMLSVLLHEYGHVLGIEHSTDPHDYMGTTLAPGVRRLPSADELTLMAKLTGEARAALEATADTPSDPSSPSPTLPLGTSLALVLAGRLRGTRYGAWNIDPSGVKLVPQYDIAANPQLANTGFTGSANDANQADGWATTGEVHFANGAATLSERASTQSRLNQVFVLGEHDRFLSFTVAGTVGDQAAGPDDGFEVALLDANSGLSLLGATGLTDNDAFLNRQADGTENKASGVSVVANTDGSRTYLIDLAGIPAGTAVNLSFDLIGFGQGAEASNSQITIRDLRLGVPQTADDAATLAEDTPTDIDALANDFNARQSGFAPVVVQGPAHGAVTVNADGSFRYTPEANWNGEDSFSYALKEVPLGDKLSDGAVDSNLATVRLTVTPVNDAPTAADLTLSGDEDAPIAGNLLTGATDIEGDALQAAIVTGPQHGTLVLNGDGGFLYTPEANYHGADSFTYALKEVPLGDRVNDAPQEAPLGGGELDSSLANVALTIASVNDAPTIAPLTVSLDEDTPVVVDLLQGAATSFRLRRSEPRRTAPILALHGAPCQKPHQCSILAQ